MNQCFRLNTTKKLPSVMLQMPHIPNQKLQIIALFMQPHLKFILLHVTLACHQQID